MWNNGWRERVWSELDTAWDLIVIGGGITGAGILNEAARAGLRVLLVEAQDFAAGTSSRSSKMVHGGFRYLKNAQIKLTMVSVRERERLLREGRGLVNSLGFLIASFHGDAIPWYVFGAGLAMYDLLALKWSHRFYDAFDLRELCPPLAEEGLVGGYRYWDAQTDDARLVLRVIQDAVRAGGVALNYTKACDLLRDHSGQVSGVVLQDNSGRLDGRTLEVRAPLVINATGAWADDLRQTVGGSCRLRKLRGSHLLFPAARLPITRAITFLHPQDGRPVFAFPWEGVALVGTTDVDHEASLNEEPVISAQETDYLLRAVQFAFPEQELTLQDVQATLAGVRPVINTGKADPCKESREHVLWLENGLLTVAGGKLTTYRQMAGDALKLARAHLPEQPASRLSRNLNQRALDDPPAFSAFPEGMSTKMRLRLLGRLGADAPQALAAAGPQDLEPIAGTPDLWLELRWAARAEAMEHLDDLLLRRVRLGLLLPEGALGQMDRIRQVVQPELGWDAARWEQEVSHYANLWKRCYYLAQE